jgi:hypothetical protein
MAGSRKSDPIKRVELRDGRVRYRFVVDAGTKPNGSRDQRTFTFDTLREARAERARIISERAQGVYVRPNRKLTVREYFIDQWLPTKSGKKPTTQRCYLDALAQVLAEYGKLPLQSLDVPHLESLKRRMLSGELRRAGKAGTPLSARSVNLMLVTVSMGLKHAMKRGLVVQERRRSRRSSRSRPRRRERPSRLANRRREAVPSLSRRPPAPRRVRTLTARPAPWRGHGAEVGGRRPDRRLRGGASAAEGHAEHRGC